MSHQNIYRLYIGMQHNLTPLLGNAPPPRPPQGSRGRPRGYQVFPHSLLTFLACLSSFHTTDRPPARVLQAGGHSGGHGRLAALSNSRGPDRRGGPVQQAAGLGPGGLRAHLRQGKHGRGTDGHHGQSQVCFSFRGWDRKKRQEEKEPLLRKNQQSSPSIFQRRHSHWCAMSFTLFAVG